MQIELPDDDEQDPEPATDGGSSTLSFANVDSAQSESDASLLQRLPGRQAFALGFCACLLLTITVTLAAAALF